MPARFLIPLTLACALAMPAPALAAAAPTPAPSTPVAEPPPAFDAASFGWRHGQLTVHQALGLTTLVSMAATAGMGYWLAEQGGSSGVMDGHLMLAGLTTGLYLTTATLALTVPPNPIQGDEGPWDTVGLHRKLAWLHAAGMASTLTLGLLTNFKSLSLSPYHGIAAYTTVGLMALSAGVIAFGE